MTTDPPADSGIPGGTARPYAVETAARLMEAEFAAKWQARADIGPLPRQALRAIHDLILATGAPVPVAAVSATLPGEKPGAVAEAVATLDERDLIAMSDGHVVLANPLAARPTRFEVHLPDGRVRHAVCAIDALGLPALLGEPVGIRSTCLHCQEPVWKACRWAGPRRRFPRLRLK